MNSRHLARTSVNASKWISLACAGVVIAGCASRQPAPLTFRHSPSSVASNEPTTGPTTAPSLASILDGMMMFDGDDTSSPEQMSDSADAIAMVPAVEQPSMAPQAANSSDSPAMSEQFASVSDSISMPSAMNTPSNSAKTSSSSMSSASPPSFPSMSSMTTPSAMPKVKDENAFAAEAEFSAGHLAQTENRLDAAAEHFAKALAMNPRYPAAAFRLGVVKSTLKQYDQAIEAWWTYVRLTDGSAESYACLGYCFELAGKSSEAEAAYKRGIARDMRNQLCRVNYGLMLARLGREDESLAQLTVALPAAEAHYNLASIYELQGRHDKARAEYRRAKQIDTSMWQAEARMRAMDDPRHANEGPTGNSSSVAGTRE